MTDSVPTTRRRCAAGCGHVQQGGDAADPASAEPNDKPNDEQWSVRLAAPRPSKSSPGPEGAP